MVNEKLQMVNGLFYWVNQSTANKLVQGKKVWQAAKGRVNNQLHYRIGGGMVIDENHEKLSYPHTTRHGDSLAYLGQ